MNDSPVWRRAGDADLDAILEVQSRVHTIALESRAVFAGKREAFPAGTLVFDRAGTVLGYGVFHPWRVDDIPALHALPFRAPERPDCLFIHDVALLPEARGLGAARAVVARAREEAQGLGLGRLALVSVYGTVPIWSRCGFAMRAAPAEAAAGLVPYGETARYMVSEFGR